MARPKKTGLDYFPFDVDFFEDEKLVAIAGEYGIKGEITAIKLLCAIYRNGYFIEWSEMMQMKMLKSLPGISVDLLNQIVARLVKWGFFNKALFDSDNVLSSVGIQRRFFQSIKRRNAKCDFPYLLLQNKVSACNNGVSACNNPVQTEFLHAKSTQSKVKNKKNISTDVEIKKSPPSSPSIETEIEALKSDDIWLDQLQVLHHVDKQNLIARLADFRLQCLADGKECHTSLQDAKKHFNAWLNKNKNSPPNDNNTPQRCNQRRGHLLKADEPQDYNSTF